MTIVRACLKRKCTARQLLKKKGYQPLPNYQWVYSSATDKNKHVRVLQISERSKQPDIQYNDKQSNRASKLHPQNPRNIHPGACRNFRGSADRSTYRNQHKGIGMNSLSRKLATLFQHFYLPLCFLYTSCFFSHLRNTDILNLPYPIRSEQHLKRFRRRIALLFHQK